MTINKKVVSDLLKPGDYIYINASGKAIPSKCIAIDENGIETEHDYYPYREHHKFWWLTSAGAKKDLEGE